MSKRRRLKDSMDFPQGRTVADSIRDDEKIQALKPLQDITSNDIGVGDRVLYQSMVIRRHQRQINEWKSRLNDAPINDQMAFTKGECKAQIKLSEKKEEAALYTLGKIVYEPVIAVINEQEQQERQQDDDGDVVMSENIGGKKRRKSRRKKRRRKNLKKRTKRRR